MKTLRPIAIYLPQFHPVPENDAWWGKGFTEWHNVAQARPRFRGHYQPHLPADLGYYDLRLAEVREAQARLAAAYGIHGFCYYHYWFHGKRMLERPFQEVFDSGKPDFPFMLAWANENWTRNWDTRTGEMLLEQTYSAADHIAHINALIPYFRDPRYLRVGDRPVFVVYRQQQIPDVAGMVSIFRRVARENGMELYLCRFDTATRRKPVDPAESGFDAAIEFQPFTRTLSALDPRPAGNVAKRFWRFRKRFDQFLRENPVSRLMPRQWTDRDIDIDHERYVDVDLDRPAEKYKCFPGVTPSWDNSARRRHARARIFLNSAPPLFRRWVEGKARKFVPYSADENFIFVNAWNEWAEGNHLEPCVKYGHAWLEALRDGLAAGCR